MEVHLGIMRGLIMGSRLPFNFIERLPFSDFLSLLFLIDLFCVLWGCLARKIKLQRKYLAKFFLFFDLLEKRNFGGKKLFLQKGCSINFCKIPATPNNQKLIPQNYQSH
jgi:hypothetical protein